MCLATLFAVSLLAPVAASQISEAKAVSEAKAASKTALAQLKAGVNDERDTFLSHVADVEAKLKDGSAQLSDLDGLFDAAVDMQSSVQGFIVQSELECVQGVQTALADLAGGSDLAGVYPTALEVGTGGVIDDYEASAARLLGKTYATLDARLNKTEALAAKGGALTLRVTLRPPHHGKLSGAASEKAASFFYAGLGIDVLWAVRDASNPNSGQIFAAGSQVNVEADLGDDFLVYEIGESFGASQGGSCTAGGTGRWTASIGALHQGSYICDIESHADPNSGLQGDAFGIP
jgi:hypothetical protein